MKLIRRLLLALTGLLVLAALAAGLLVATAPGQNLLAAMASRLGSTQTQTLQISGLTGLATGKLRLERLELGDEKGAAVVLYDVALDWSPLDLFYRSIDIERLSARRIVILRLLAAGEEAAEDASALPDWDIRIQAFSFDDILLDAALADEETHLAATGDFALQRQPVALRLNLDTKRIDDIPGTLSAKIAFTPQSGQLDLDVALREPSGGTLARLLDISGLPAIALDVKGGGSLANWNAELVAGFDGREAVTGTAHIAAVDDGHRLTASLNGTPGPLLPRIVTPLAAGDVALALDVRRKSDGSVDIATAQMTSATTRISANGRIDFAAQIVDLTAALQFGEAQSEIAFALPDGSEARLGAGVLGLRAQGALTNADITFTGTLASLRAAGYEGAALSLQAKTRGGDLIAQTVPFSLTFASAALRIPESGYNRLLAGPFKLDAAGLWHTNEISLESMTAASDALQITAAGDIVPLDGAFDLGVKAKADARLHEQARIVFGDGAVGLSTRIARNADGALSVRNLIVESDGLGLTGQASLDLDTIDARFDLSYGDLRRLNSNITGKATASIVANGSLAAPKVEVLAAGQDIFLAGKALESPTLSFNGTASATAPSGDLKIAAMLDGKPLEATGQIVSSQSGTALQDINIVVGGATLRGAAQHVLSGQINGSFNIDVPDLAMLGPLLLRDDISGSLAGRINIAPADGAWGVSTVLEIPALQVAGVALKNSLVDAVVSMLDSGPVINGKITSASLQSGDTQLANITISAAGTGNETEFEAEAMLDGAPLAAKGRVHARNGVTGISVDQASGAFKGVVAKLSAPATAEFSGGTLRLAPIALSVGGGSLTLSGSAGEALNLDVAFKALSAAVIDQFAKQGLAGTLSGALAITGTAVAPQVAYDIDWRNASATALRAAGAPPLSVAAKGRYAGERVDVTAAMTGGGMNASLSGAVVLGVTPRADLAVTGAVPFSVAAVTLARSGLRLDGAAALDIAITGALANPQISGTVSTKNATFIDTGSAIVIKNIAGTARLSGQTIVIDGLTGTLGTSGKLTVSGSIGSDVNAGFPADLTIAMRDGRYADGTLVAATFGADLTLKGPLAGTPLLGGRVDVARADISIPEKLPNAVSPLGVTHVNASDQVLKQTQQLEEVTGSTSAGGGLALDLTVSAPRRIYVRGRGLDAELGGSLRLSGTTAATRAVGAFTLVRGRFDILTRRLNINRGNITFSGSLDPVIAFAATTSANGVSATINVSGLASQPRISFSSSPSLPEDEVLAQLLFNKSLTSLSAIQVVQLANALATLTGASGNSGILDRLRDSVGIDNLDVTSDEGGEGAAVGVGRYLNDRTYIGVKQGTTSGNTSVTTNIDLTDTLKAKGEVNSQGETKAGIFFEKAY